MPNFDDFDLDIVLKPVEGSVTPSCSIATTTVWVTSAASCYSSCGGSSNTAASCTTSCHGC
ncbi:hypothetical protein AM499_08920 [Bacillus sp. FJAT-22090]|uniref:hypothetical protein n=1 Tax=Bacillus sp. FJAT-22090 TaxID=1581038 RepID=UPI0006AF171B|nr:hypothetical protein [Bacillus sp. FJAT-22090]ALC85933.1 hypothetical protein AM499_08920 [Bacillus sp. FJAT-22090]